MVSVYKAVKQEMSAEEVEGVEHGQYSGEGSLCWLDITFVFQYPCKKKCAWHNITGGALMNIGVTIISSHPSRGHCG